jgi:hypothetical protein
VNPSLYSKMPFDVEKDLIPVTKAGARRTRGWSIRAFRPRT